MITKKEFLSAKKVVVQYWEDNIKEQRVSKKMYETELYVDTYIQKNGKPPTYRDVAKMFKLGSVSVAYARLRRYRNVMSSKKNKHYGKSFKKSTKY